MRDYFWTWPRIADRRNELLRNAKQSRRRRGSQRMKEDGFDVQTFFTEEQRQQVQDFVAKYQEHLDWMCSASGVDTLADKGQELDSNRISEAYMCQLLMMFALDEMKNIEGMTPEHMADRISSMILMWTREMGNFAYREPLRPLWKDCL